MNGHDFSRAENTATLNRCHAERSEASARSGWRARQPSNVPAATLWIYNPTVAPMSLDEHEASINILVEHFYRSMPPRYEQLMGKRAAGLSPTEALRLIGDHLDDRISEEYLR